jgi:hypothetical protein
VRCASAVALTAAISTSLLTASPASAEEWRTSFVLYGQFFAIDGTASVGDLSIDADLSFDELADHLDASGAVAMRSETDVLALNLDAEYSALTAHPVDSVTQTAGEIETGSTTVALNAARRFSERFEVYAGVRYVALDLRVSAVRGSSKVSGDRDVDWVDPLVGARVELPLGERWTLTGSADVGGFGVGSELALNLLATLEWHIKPTFDVLFGYRALDIDYDHSDNGVNFEYDVLTLGPGAGVRFTF